MPHQDTQIRGNVDALINSGRLTTGRLVQVGEIENKDFPDIADLAARLRFSIKEGRIWLDTQRVALIHLTTLGSLRRELIASLGTQEAKGFLTRMGYASGSRDAELARKLRPHHSMRDAFFVGPQLRIIQGTAAMEPVQVDLDVATGRFYGEFVWRDSFEVDAHLSAYGISSKPVCWMQLGHACGYASTFMGRSILFREVECCGTGSRRCRIIGRPLEEWGNIDEDLRALHPEGLGNLFGGEPVPVRRRQRATPAAADRLSYLPASMVGTSVGFLSTCQMLEKVAGTEATVLFLGETGVGKEMFASALHQMSRRANKPFVAVNCAAIPENLLESELFGVEKGAFTGASASRPGRFERADGGTLFLDEVGTLTMTAQLKLLRAIQQKEIERVGDSTTRKVNVRIVAATNVDLDAAVRAGEFRVDLLYRLNVFPISIPPVRERRDDIPLLIEHFLMKFSTLHGKTISGFTERAEDALYDYDYPGNIRELENLIERAVILVEDGEMIDVTHLFSSGDKLTSLMLKLTNDNRTRSLDTAKAEENSATELSLLDQIFDRGLALEDLESELIEEAVERSQGNLSQAARLLGMTRPQLAYRLRKRHPEMPSG